MAGEVNEEGERIVESRNINFEKKKRKMCKYDDLMATANKLLSLDIKR